MKSLWPIWWISLAVKIVIAVLLPFANDEAYYWVWGHHPALSYFDHPGMVGWLFLLGSWLEGFGNAARLPGVLLAHCTLLIWCDLVTPFLKSEKEKYGWFLLILFSPFLGLGSLLLTPDSPFLFFWSLSLWLLLRAVRTNRLGFYAALGAALGLGFCSKYLIVLFVPCAFVWLFVSKAWRSVDTKKVLVTVIVGLLFSAPVLLWNSSHDWVSFKFQLDHGLGATEWSARWPLEYLAAQIALLFPIAVYFAVREKSAPGTSHFQIFGWLPFAFFFYSSFRARGEANWPAMAHPEILALAYIGANGSKWIKSQASLWAILTALIFVQVLWPWIPVEPQKLKTSEFTKYDAFASVASERNDLFLSSYQMAAAVSYKARRQFYKLAGMNRRDFYDFMPESYPTGDSFVVGTELGQSLPKWVSEAGYSVVNERQLSNQFRLIEVSRSAKDGHR